MLASQPVAHRIPAWLILFLLLLAIILFGFIASLRCRIRCSICLAARGSCRMVRGWISPFGFMGLGLAIRLGLRLVRLAGGTALVSEAAPKEPDQGLDGEPVLEAA